jgi:hypothetical protein
MDEPKIMNLDAFRVLISTYCGCVHRRGLDYPKSVEEWMTDLLNWLHYPESIISLSRKADVTSWLEIPFAELFEDGFDWDKYHNQPPKEEPAEQAGGETPEVKRGRLRLVE